MPTRLNNPRYHESQLAGRVALRLQARTAVLKSSYGTKPLSRGKTGYRKIADVPKTERLIRALVGLGSDQRVSLLRSDTRGLNRVRLTPVPVPTTPHLSA